jgi:hypothetical protein
LGGAHSSADSQRAAATIEVAVADLSVGSIGWYFERRRFLTMALIDYDDIYREWENMQRLNYISARAAGIFSYLSVNAKSGVVGSLAETILAPRKSAEWHEYVFLWDAISLIERQRGPDLFVLIDRKYSNRFERLMKQREVIPTADLDIVRKRGGIALLLVRARMKQVRIAGISSSLDEQFKRIRSRMTREKLWPNQITDAQDLLKMGAEFISGEPFPSHVVQLELFCDDIGITTYYAGIPRPLQIYDLHP